MAGEKLVRRALQAAREAAKPLPMDEASRMARAEALNFNPTTFYHATSREFPAFDMRRAGEGATIGKGERAAFLVNRPAVADSYLGGQYVNRENAAASGFSTADMGENVGRYYTPGSQVMPVRVRDLDQFTDWDFGGGFYTPDEMAEVLRHAKKEGAPGAIIRNVRDPGFNTADNPVGNPRLPSAVLAVRDPSFIRSVFARFDPEKITSKDLLAGGAGVGAVGAAMEAGNMAQPEATEEPREGFQKGGRLISEALDLIRKLPPAENSRLTQIATTGPSYKKALSHLERAGIEGRAIDYGAGRGHGLREIGADTFEPYPQGWSPTYTKPEEIPDEVYRRLVNLNVLNVLDPQARESAVLNMGRIVEPGGGGVISTRGRDVMSARGEPGPEPMSLIIGEGDQARYQKGFTPRELREYVGDTLGSRFDVEPSDVGQASIMFRRNREDGGAVDYNDAPNYALDAETSRFNMGDVFAPLSRGLSQGKSPDRAENIPLARPVAPPEPDVVNRALNVVRAEPRPMDIKVSRQAPPPPRPVPRPAPRPAPAPAQAAPNTSESRRLWEIYNETGNPADFVRASNAMRAGRAEGGEVRDGYAGGGKPLQQALEAAARYIRPRSPEQAAVDVAGLLRAAREKEVTDSLLEQADPRALLELYAAGRTGADMPMDYASRMGRAADQGFNKLIYRGTQSREALNRSLQTDRLEEGSKTFGTGSWASSDPDVAGTYSGLSEFSPVTMPLMVRGSELREVPWGGGLWSEGPGGQTTDRVARAAREEGAKGLTFSNITDIGPHLWNRADTQKRLPDTSDTTVIFDPSIVRSPFARFDPRLEHLLDLNRKDGGRAVDVARETLLEDEYPTHYLPNVGRQVMADGGMPAAGERYEAMPGFFSRMLGLNGGSQPEADIQQYENRMRAIARQPEDIRSMTHAPSRPMRPVQIEGGLIGKRTLGEAPYDVAGPLSGIAQTAYSLKTLPFYFTPAAPLAAAADFGEAAIDTAKAAREGDYLGAGITGALGVAMPGYAYRKPIGDVVGRALNAIRGNPGAVGAGAAGAAVMMPEEAEAAKTRAVQQAIASARAIARAKELGYDTSKVWYHSALTPIKKFEPHGKFMGRSGVSGIHLTDNPEMANRYLERYGSYDYQNRPFEKNVMPVFVKTKNVLEQDEPFRWQVSMGQPVPEDYRSPLLDIGYDALLRNEAINRRGDVKHVAPGSRGAIEGKELVLTDPSQVRSIYDEYADGGSVEGQSEPGIVEKAFSFLSQFNPVGTAEAAKLRAAQGITRIAKGTPDHATITAEEALRRVVSPFSSDPESIKRALEIAAAYRVPQGTEFGTNSFFRKKPVMGVGDVQADVAPLPGVSPVERRPMSWEDFAREAKGGTLINVGGDRLNLGMLRDINNENRLAWDVPLHAGPRYMLEPNPGLVWANAPSHTTSFNRIIKNAAKEGPVYGVYAPMGPTAVDSSVGMFNAVMSQIPTSKISSDTAKKFDEFVRSGDFMSDPDKRAGAAEVMSRVWPGIANIKDQQSVLALADQLTGTQRGDLVKSMETPTRRKQGFPDIGTTRVAVTDPELLSAPTNTIGHRIVRFDTDGQVSPTRIFPHQTYPTESLGRYVADVPLVQTQYGMPTAMERVLMKPTSKGQIVHPYSLDDKGRSSARKLFTEQKQLQPVNDQLIESIMMGLERQREYGFRRGGGVSHYAMMLAKELGSLPRETVKS